MPEPQPKQSLAHPVGVLYEIRWNEICPWLILVKALRVTLLIRVLALALIGVLLTQWGSSTIDGFFSTDAASLTRLTDAPAAEKPFELPLKAEQPVKTVLAQAAKGAFLRGWHWVAAPFLQLADRKISWQTSLVLLAQGSWMIALWAVFGGAIARTAALYVTRGETISPVVALRDAITVWPSTVGSPLIALLGASALAVPLVLLGFLLRLNLVAAVTALLWCIVFAWGLMLAVLLLGLLIGWPLMWACMGVERSDAFDGVSRCGAYVYQKPLQLAFYVLVTTLLVLLSETVVNLFAASSIAFAEWFLSWGLGNARADELFSQESQSLVSPLAIRAVNGWKSGMSSLIQSFPLACLWSMSVGIYLLMRRHVDSTEMDEITLSDGTTQAGLPNLKEKDLGVPEVEQTSQNGNPNANDE